MTLNLTLTSLLSFTRNGKSVMIGAENDMSRVLLSERCSQSWVQD